MTAQRSLDRTGSLRSVARRRSHGARSTQPGADTHQQAEDAGRDTDKREGTRTLRVGLSGLDRRDILSWIAKLNRKLHGGRRLHCVKFAVCRVERLVD